MKTHTVVAMALLSVGVLAGLSAVPVQAVSADCSIVPGQAIPDTQQSPRESLAGQASETWHLNVSSSDPDPTVRVELNSNNDELEFGIFELDGNDCVRVDAAKVSPAACEDDVRLSTAGLTLPPKSQDCTLDAPDMGTQTYYFVLENLQSDSLDFSIWVL